MTRERHELEFPLLAVLVAGCSLPAGDIGAVRPSGAPDETDESGEPDEPDEPEADATTGLDESSDGEDLDPWIDHEVPSAILDCDEGYPIDVHRLTIIDHRRLWVAGVYQTNDDHFGDHHPQGEAAVDWSLPGDNVLVLSAYEPTRWEIRVSDEGSLARVLAFGYHPQVVVAPPGVEVEVVSTLDDAAPYIGGHWLPISAASKPPEGDDGDSSALELVRTAEARTGRRLTGFDGCYDAGTFSYGFETTPYTPVP